MNKYTNPIDSIGVKPSGTEVNIPDLHSNLTFNELMQERNTLPFQSSNTEIRYSGDADVTRLHVFNSRMDEFQEDETIVGVAIYVDSENPDLSPFNGLYLQKGPTTHSKLRSAVQCNTDIKLPMYHDNFADREYIHGFYTNKGRFLTRRQTLRLVETNNLPTNTPIGEINPRDGCMSTDIWKEVNSGDGYIGSIYLSSNVTSSVKGSGKIKPPTVSEMMRAKKLKKRKFS